MSKDKHTPRLRRDIEENLKRVYEEPLKEQVPDRFMKLLDQLRAQEGDR